MININVLFLFGLGFKLHLCLIVSLIVLNIMKVKNRH